MLTLKINSRDLSAYVQGQHEKGLELPTKDRVKAQFAGSTAFRDGVQFSRNSVGNGLFTVPLLLYASSTDLLHALMRDIQNELYRGAVVQWANDSASGSTFWDLETGQLDEQFEFFIAQANKNQSILRLEVRSHGHTGTKRTIINVTGSGPQQLNATGIIGDVDALANVEVRVGSQVASAGRVIGVAVHRHPSFKFVKTPADITDRAAGATTIGDSRGLASQIIGIPIMSTGASGYMIRDYLTPPDAHVGRHRVIALVTSLLSAPVPVYAVDRFGAVLGPTQLATQTDVNKLQVMDLGEVQVPARMTGQEPVPTNFVEIRGGGASGNTILQSPAFRIGGLFYLPLDYSPGLLRTKGAENTTILSDSFTRFVNGAPLVDLKSDPYVEVGNAQWSQVASQFITDYEQGIGVKDGGSGLYTLWATGRKWGDTILNAKVRLWSLLAAPSAMATGAVFDMRQNTDGGATRGLRTVLKFGPSAAISLALLHHSGSATTLIASRSLAGSAASGLMAGQEFIVSTKKVGPVADVYLGTVLGPSPLFSASHANIGGDGGLAVAMNGNGVAAAGFQAGPQMRSISLLAAATAPDIDGREWFRFESHPEERVIQSNASVFKADRTADYRGVPIELPPVGSPAPSGAARIFVFEGELDNFKGQETLDVRVDVLERFSYLR